MVIGNWLLEKYLLPIPYYLATKSVIFNYAHLLIK